MCISIDLVYLGDMDRLANTMCELQIETRAAMHICLFDTLMCVAYSIGIFCGYKVLHLIRTQQSEAMHHELETRLQDVRYILSDYFRINLKFRNAGFNFLYVYIQYILFLIVAFTFGLFISHPALDPLAIVFVMKL